MSFISKSKKGSSRNFRKPRATLQNKKKQVSKAQTKATTLKSFQNAVVLAPFHTLKKSFQTQLADLYSKKVIKKNKNKLQLASTENASFEYDIVELQPQKTTQKNHKPVIMKKRSSVTDSKRKNNYKQGYNDYCQCNTPTSEPSNEAPQNFAQEAFKTNQKFDHIPGTSIQGFFELSTAVQQETITKKRKLNNTINDSYNTEDTHFYLPPERNISSSSSNSSSKVMEETSELDTIESYSDLNSLQNQYLEGSLVVSTTSITTSFGSCVEESKKHSPTKNKFLTSEQIHLDNAKTNCDYKSNSLNSLDGYLPRRKANESRHLILNEKAKSSDEEIVDFLDREPQAQGITSSDIPQNIQPLRRASKTSETKSERERNSSKSYFLRSVNSNKCMEQSSVVKSTSFNENKEKHTKFLVSPSPKEKSSKTLSKKVKRSKARLQDNIDAAEDVSKSDNNSTIGNYTSKDETDKICETLCLIDSSPSKNKSDVTLVDVNKSEENITVMEGKTKSAETNYQANLPSEPSCAALDIRDSTATHPIDNLNISCSLNSESLETKKSEHNSNLENPSSPQYPTSNEKKLNSEENNNDLVEVLPDFENNIVTEETATIEKLDFERPDGRESNFLLGSESSSTKIGESCEISFGPNWSDHDKDDSDTFF